MISEEQRRELIKSKKSFMSLFDGFLVEISTTSSVDKQNLNKLLEGLKKIIFVQLTNLKNKELQIILNEQLDYVKKLEGLIKDVKQNKKVIVNIGNDLRDNYKNKEKGFL